MTAGSLYRSTAGLESISSLLKLYMSNNEIQVLYTVHNGQKEPSCKISIYVSTYASNDFFFPAIYFYIINLSRKKLDGPRWVLLNKSQKISLQIQ
jgi:hypothetical protein